MGCGNASSAEAKERPKQFSEMTKEEKEQAKKLMEEQDKDLKE